MKFVFCDDKQDLIKYHHLQDAFNSIGMEEKEIWYLTLNKETSKPYEKVYFSVYNYVKDEDKWIVNRESVDIDDEKLESEFNALFNEAVILLDTLWSKDNNIERSKIKKKIVEWCKTHKNKYKKVFVYTTHGPDEADNLIKELKSYGICVYEFRKDVSPAPGFVQKQDLIKFLQNVATFTADN